MLAGLIDRTASGYFYRPTLPPPEGRSTPPFGGEGRGEDRTQSKLIKPNLPRGACRGGTLPFAVDIGLDRNLALPNDRISDKNAPLWHGSFRGGYRLVQHGTTCEILLSNAKNAANSATFSKNGVKLLTSRRSSVLDEVHDSRLVVRMLHPCKRRGSRSIRAFWPRGQRFRSLRCHLETKRFPSSTRTATPRASPTQGRIAGDQVFRLVQSRKGHQSPVRCRAER
jgi:hypothetical protein